MNTRPISFCLAAASFTVISLSTVDAPFSLFQTTGNVERTQIVGAEKYSIAASDAPNQVRIVSISGDSGHAPALFSPKTELGKALWAARKRIVASGEPLVPAAKLLADLDESRI